VTLILLVLIGVLVLIQLLYYLFVFARLLGESNVTNHVPTQGVSVIVCAWNEKENLEELLPLLNAQNYPEFEVIVMDDRSSDGTKEFLEENSAQWEHIRFIRVNSEFDHVTPKKYAITVAIKTAKYPVVLMTDADCRPAGENWIATMAARISLTKGLVLGFSPYFEMPGLLNWFIRCETFYTAVQYLSFAKMGSAYMGVGRNLMYKTELFWENRGFYAHKNVVGGDDDLFINQVSDRINVAINLDPESYTYSIPKTTWGAWFTQKRRHLSVSSFYRPRNKFLLGMLSGSHTLLWILGIVALAQGIVEQDWINLQILGGLFGGRWLLQMIILGLINSKTGKTVGWYTFIFMDFALVIYYLVMSSFVFVRPKKVRWR
jgi:glycosyltransferase involved in cell wall biosynthesis